MQGLDLPKCVIQTAAVKISWPPEQGDFLVTQRECQQQRRGATFINSPCLSRILPYSWSTISEWGVIYSSSVNLPHIRSEQDAELEQGNRTFGVVRPNPYNLNYGHYVLCLSLDFSSLHRQVPNHINVPTKYQQSLPFHNIPPALYATSQFKGASESRKTPAKLEVEITSLRSSFGWRMDAWYSY